MCGSSNVILSILKMKRNLLNTRGADKSLARITSRCIFFVGENIYFYASLVIYTYSMEQSPS